MSSYKIIDTGIKNPDISIMILAYNHSKYIVEAIESVLMQKTSYSYKIIIAEDNSPDDTRVIILEYQTKYPDKFKIILQNENVGSQRNSVDLLSNSEGKYLAILEGDDYWTDSLKLQKQISFLEANEDYSMVCHNATIIYEGINKKPTIFNKSIKSEDVSMDSIINKWTIPTASMVLRNKYIENLPLWYGKCLNGDLAIALHLRNSGNIRFICENMSVYRRSYNGTSITATHLKAIEYKTENLFLLLDFFNEETNYQYNALIEIKKEKVKKNNIFNKLLSENKFKAFIYKPNIFMVKIFEKIISYRASRI
jgi:glycosyltransferase involved in cell wall biosynthesis